MSFFKKHKKKQQNKGKSSDFAFVESYYRTVLADSTHDITVLLNDSEFSNSKPDVKDKHEDSEPANETSKHRILYPQEKKTFLSYAAQIDDSVYSTQYVMTDFLFSDDDKTKAYCIGHDDNGITIFQALNINSNVGTLLASIEIKYKAYPVLLIETDKNLILAMNAMPMQAEQVQIDMKQREADGLPVYAGYLYIVQIDIMTGEWQPLFESDKSICYSAYGLCNQDDQCGILLANICNEGHSILTMPRKFSEIPDFVMSDIPQDTSSANIPFGISVYDPVNNSFSIIPAGGNSSWGIKRVTVDKHADDILVNIYDDMTPMLMNIVNISHYQPSSETS